MIDDKTYALANALTKAENEEDKESLIETLSSKIPELCSEIMRLSDAIRTKMFVSIDWAGRDMPTEAMSVVVSLLGMIGEGKFVEELSWSWVAIVRPEYILVDEDGNPLLDEDGNPLEGLTESIMDKERVVVDIDGRVVYKMNRPWNKSFASRSACEDWILEQGLEEVLKPDRCFFMPFQSVSDQKIREETETKYAEKLAAKNNS